MYDVMCVVHLVVAPGSRHWCGRVLRSLAKGATLKLEQSVGALEWHRCSWSPGGGPSRIKLVETNSRAHQNTCATQRDNRIP